MYNLLRSAGLIPILSTFKHVLIKGGVHKEYLSDLSLLIFPLNFIVPVLVTKLLKNRMNLMTM